MRSHAKSTRTALTLIVLCALALVGIAPTSAADMLNPQLKANYEFTIRGEDEVDLTLIMTASGLPGEAFSQFCRKENFPTIEGPNPATVEQIEQDGEPACKISTTNIPPEGTSSISWSISHENGKFIFSATTKADLDDATMTVNFPGKAVKASEGGKTDGNSATWTGLSTGTSVTATGKDSPSQPWIWVAVGAIAVLVIGGGIALVVVLRVRRNKRANLARLAPPPGQQPAPLNQQLAPPPGQQPGSFTG